MVNGLQAKVDIKLETGQRTYKRISKDPSLSPSLESSFIKRAAHLCPFTKFKAYSISLLDLTYFPNVSFVRDSTSHVLP